jgi:signal transduction histidine kinase
MIEIKAMASNPNKQQRLWVGSVVIVGIISAVMLIIYLTSAVQWRQRPFIGVLFTPLLAVDTSQPVSDATWPGLAAGLQTGDHIVAVNDQPLFTPSNEGRIILNSASDYEGAWSQFHTTMASLAPGDEVTVQFNRAPNNVEPCATASTLGDCQVTLTVDLFPDGDFVGYFIVPFITAIATYVIGLGTLWLRPNQPAARLMSVIAFTLAVLLGGLFDIDATHVLIPLWLVANALLGGALMTLALIFPAYLPVLYRAPRLRYVPLVISLATIPIYLWLNAHPPSPQFQINILPFLLVVIGIVLLIATSLFHRRYAHTGVIRDQSNTILIGFFLTSVPIVIWGLNSIVLAVTGRPLVPFNVPAATPFILVAPISMAYAVIEYRLRDTDRIISQGITYSLMLIALVSGYALLVFSLSLVLTQPENLLANNPFLIGATIFLIAILFLPFRTFLQRQIDRIYFRQRYNYQEHAEAFTQEVSQLRDLPQLAQIFRSVLARTVVPSNVFIFVPDHQTTQYVALGNPEPETDIQFQADSGILRALDVQEPIIYLEPGREWPPALRTERPRLQILDALVILGLRGSEQFNGFICIGPPQSGKGRYTHEELFFIQSLVNQLSIAAERTQIVESLQRRVRELDVLSQVGKAVNFAINLDDLMELLSAQTNKLIAASYFYIALRDNVLDELSFAFFLEDDERYPEKENRSWPLGSDLFSEVVRHHQPVRVADYGAAMVQRNVQIDLADPELQAWMGVPLVAGTTTLGVMAVGTKQVGKTYGNDQFRIFTDISSLAATSIEKARLFAETNRRARQLAALNDISNQLATEQRDLDKLLDLITSSAVNILNAEAGSLLLMTEDEDEQLEFAIAVGAASQDLVGQRLPAKQGLAGEVVRTGRYLIVNDTSRDARWQGEVVSSDFQTASVLAVPLITNNQTLGVLEVLNKKERGVFLDEDANLLLTFAGQAAVAIDNARLFQMTDKQLSDRVQELETLERIDVELNRSLDTRAVAERTLRWAIAQTGATAGVLGIVTGEPPMLEIAARYGYRDTDLPEGFADSLWPLDQGIISRVMRTRQADLAPDVKIDPHYLPGQKHCLSQITVPMMSGSEINALLVLEKNTEPRLNLVDLAFVQRLTEHASIALVNAQLYVDLARANDSKSEFVSFVAHELKNPMTSIKGYTDLLLAGATGDVNEQQETFLSTIKGNIERMNTLVSDLNDVTKLQTNNFNLELGPVDFRTVVLETLRPLERQLEEKEQAVEILLPDDLPPIWADQNRLIQVMTNMLSNAHKYSPRQGLIQVIGEIIGQPERTNGAGPALHIYVKDHGIGMSEDDLGNLFTPYFRSDNPEAREQPGTGLGLTITRGIVERHGGQIWVDSQLGGGTEFHFTVPLAAEKEPSES